MGTERGSNVITLRRPISVEKLLHWTYREELPKSPYGTGSMLDAAPIFRLAELGTVVDTSYEPGFPAIMGAPHPDALLVDHAVRGLERIGGECRGPSNSQKPGSIRSGRAGIQRARVGSDIAELAEYIGDDLPPGWIGNLDTTIRAFEPASMLILYAQLGTRPIWDLGPTRVEPSRGNRRQPEISFLDQEGNRISGSKRGGYYSSGACCELRYDPPAFEVACARAEYLVWFVSLVRVERALSTLNLAAWTVELPTAASLPWRSGETDKRRILQSIPARVAVA